MIRYHASWLLPIVEPPIRDGWVAVESDRIVAVGSGNTSTVVSGDETIDLGNVAILPGLVNAHTHFELSHLRGQIPAGDTFVSWVRALLAARRTFAAGPASSEILASVEQGIDDARRSGTAIVGDISNSMVTFAPLAHSPIAAVVFNEIIGFNPENADAFVGRALEAVQSFAQTNRVRARLAVHAPYSVAPSVFQSIVKATNRQALRPRSVHLSESREEVEFVRRGGGAWRELLVELGAWNSNWTPPGVSPVQYLDDLGFLDGDLLAVHGVQLTLSDLGLLKTRGVTLVTCPRSNAHTGAGTPPVAAFYESGVDVAVGTDSLASTEDLNLFSELAALRRLAPSVPPSKLLDSATRKGAQALSFGANHGTIEPGKWAQLIAVTVPAGTDDVEEYLVSGIQPDQINWLRS